LNFLIRKRIKHIFEISKVFLQNIFTRKIFLYFLHEKISNKNREIIFVLVIFWLVTDSNKFFENGRIVSKTEFFKALADVSVIWLSETDESIDDLYWVVNKSFILFAFSKENCKTILATIFLVSTLFEPFPEKFISLEFCDHFHLLRRDTCLIFELIKKLKHRLIMRGIYFAWALDLQEPFNISGLLISIKHLNKNKSCPCRFKLIRNLTSKDLRKLFHIKNSIDEQRTIFFRSFQKSLNAIWEQFILYSCEHTVYKDLNIFSYSTFS